MSAVQNNFVSVLCESKLRLEQRSHHFEKTFVSPTVNIFVERSYSLKMERARLEDMDIITIQFTVHFS